MVVRNKELCTFQDLQRLGHFSLLTLVSNIQMFYEITTVLLTAVGERAESDFILHVWEEPCTWLDPPYVVSIASNFFRNI